MKVPGAWYLALAVALFCMTEICTALTKLLDNPDLTSVQLCRYVKGPDFPTGGQILNSPTS